ncbi:hypothetical protein SLEP1_g15217 [Rubroshorea leprosula]|uniref:Uncharacterized protein n=1 Tax=Rubroshorea leprosula TaxID=152421 RepID=A0AAV5IYC5_9ROSI|nr:hypothetical protein SLEP1_g15217 [Rubroshorea leprosula]
MNPSTGKRSISMASPSTSWRRCLGNVFMKDVYYL